MTLSTQAAASPPASGPAKPGSQATSSTPATGQAAQNPGDTKGETTSGQSFESSFLKATSLIEDVDLETSAEPVLLAAPIPGNAERAPEIQLTQVASQPAKPNVPATAVPQLNTVPATATDGTVDPSEAVPELDIPAPQVKAPANTAAPASVPVPQAIQQVVATKPDLRSSAVSGPIMSAASDSAAETAAPKALQAPETPAPTSIAPPTQTLARSQSDTTLRSAVSVIDLTAPSAVETSAVGSQEGPTRTRDGVQADLPLPRQERVVSQSIAAQITQAVRGQESGRFEISLDPPELGRVTVTLSTTGDSVSAQVASDRPEIGEMLRRHNDMLHRELTNAGFRNISLDFGFQQQGGAMRDPGQSSGDGSQPETQDTVDAVTQRSSYTGSGLDLRV
ncbi:MAG: flagellar hook-length control protein FliK [Pseudomonadota bacterium]